MSPLRCVPVPVALAAVLALSPAPSGALTLDAFGTSASVKVFQGLAPVFTPLSDVRKAAFGDELSSEVGIDYQNPAANQYIEASARQDAAGNARLSYDHASFGERESYYGRVETTIGYRVTNTTSERQAVDFTFTLLNMTAEIYGLDLIGNPFTNPALDFGQVSSGAIALRYRIRTDLSDQSFGAEDPDIDDLGEDFWAIGGANEVFGADFEMWSVYLNDVQGHALRTGRVRNMAGVVDPQVWSPDDPFVAGFKATIPRDTRNVTIAELDPGESTTFVVGMQIEAYATDFEPVLRATIGDPNGIDPAVSGRVVQAPPGGLTPVPLPAAGWGLLAGVGALAGLARRRRPAACARPRSR